MSHSVAFVHANINLSRISIPERLNIHLTEVESQLCALLDDCTRRLAEKGVHTSCRIAGGWVRDKLLGSDSHDIDIALENMTGHAFAIEFTEFVRKLKHLPVKSVAVVKGNPGQSKHLETAKTSVLGLDLDFVNLRDEAYAEDSRIPTNVIYGTPLQDALRRDTTINSLFYNVHTRSIEDHCSKGLDDLKNGIIRTPLPPKQTFLDDPLRVIRCVRFASRFGFELVPELEQSARDSEIQTALLQKITRERVGEEIDKMMGGRNPLLSLRLLDALSLFPLVFHIPPAVAATLSSRPSSKTLAIAAASILHTFLQPDAALFRHPPLHPLILSGITSSTSIISRLYMACALTPYKGITYIDEKKKERPALEAVIREGLKVGTKNHYLDGIPALFLASELLKSPDIEDDRFKSPSERVAIGLLLRSTSVHNGLIGAHWTTSLFFSLIQELVNCYDASEDNFHVDVAAQVIDKYNRFASRIEELGVQKDVDAKPVLDGREVVQILGAPKPGQWTGKVLAEVVKWQLGHPGEPREECAKWLKAELAVGRVSIEDVGPSTQAKRQKNSAEEIAAKKSRK
ncbi:hypothetical protein B0F90DRAFT_1620979 [Multifurca ochricompacta]|uniref:tRNA nucleotidyltransferase n=1 Tax=Multifurca ochricompacta TaxID=376703 RepID=A0AAD4QT25_9AGAM|nr:hypothetical protein B0F90DRAFT_1620979 [Multifurca ochricompacta]